MEQRKKRWDLPDLGVGLGLRIPYYQEILDTGPNIGWFEIISENFMVEGGKPLHYLDTFLARYPIVQHGVSLSIGSTDPLDFEYLHRLKALTRRAKTPWFSDHLCWSQHNAHRLHDLLPLPYTEETAGHVAERARVVQDFIERPFLIENVSSYVGYKASRMEEWEFLRLVAERADCGILLDVNNVFVSARNHGFDPMDYLRGIPAERVMQIHVAGHHDKGTHILDTHDHPVREEVWDLYRQACRIVGLVPTMIERDDKFPPFPELMAEVQKIERIRREHGLLLQAR